MKKVCVIFDIGKTNKKCFVFDKQYRVVYQTARQFEEVKDEDGYPTDDLTAIVNWIKNTVATLLVSTDYKVVAVNFSAYGASLVHLDSNGNVLTPLYNYTKPLPANLLTTFYEKYGNQWKLAKETASPPSGMLNSGFQLYWLKKTQPELFSKIRWSLHFPQYLSYLFTGIPLSDFSSIGCHTSLWNYEKKDYHEWVYAEQIDRLLAPIVPTTSSIKVVYEGRTLKVGTGIHDSTAALFPYIQADRKPFLLVSTGTWSVSMNPFSSELLNEDDLQEGCLNYMRIDGKPVNAVRLFLGKEYQLQVEKLSQFFNKEKDLHKTITFDVATFQGLTNKAQHKFHFEYLQSNSDQPGTTNYEAFASFEQAYHQLMYELVALQCQAIQRATGNMTIRRIYIDGGFSDNDCFVKLLSLHFQQFQIRTTQSPIGSALGAAMVISGEKVGKRFLKQHYALKKHKSLILNE